MWTDNSLLSASADRIPLGTLSIVQRKEISLSHIHMNAERRSQTMISQRRSNAILLSLMFKINHSDNLPFSLCLLLWHRNIEYLK